MSNHPQSPTSSNLVHGTKICLIYNNGKALLAAPVNIFGLSDLVLNENKCRLPDKPAPRGFHLVKNEEWMQKLGGHVFVKVVNRRAEKTFFLDLFSEDNELKLSNVVVRKNRMLKVVYKNGSLKTYAFDPKDQSIWH